MPFLFAFRNEDNEQNSPNGHNSLASMEYSGVDSTEYSPSWRHLGLLALFASADQGANANSLGVLKLTQT